MIYPTLRYQEPNAAIKWLVDAFDCTEHTVYRDDEGMVVHAVLSLAGGMVMVSRPREPGWLGGGTADPLASTISVYVAIDDPTSHFERAKAAGATIVRDLEHMDYGSDEYSARDPEGNLWSFGTYRPDASRGQLKAFSPVSARPISSFCTWLVPS